MAGARPQLGTPFGTDGPWLAAILDVLHDLHDLLDERLPQAARTVRPVSEPAPDDRPTTAVPMSEPAPDEPPADEPPAAEPAPDDEPEPEEEVLEPPPRAGRGSGMSEWQAFARLAEVVYPDGATRADIIAACVKAGVIPAE